MNQYFTLIILFRRTHRTDNQAELPTILVNVVIDPITAIPTEAKTFRSIWKGLTE